MATTQLRFILDGKKYVEPVKDISVTLKHSAQSVVVRHLLKLYELEGDDAFGLLDSNVIEIEEVTDKEDCGVDLDISIKDMDKSQYESLTLTLTSNSLKYISSHLFKRNMGKEEKEEEEKKSSIPESIFVVKSEHPVSPSPPEGNFGGSSSSFQATDVPAIATENIARDDKALLQRFVSTEIAEESLLDNLSVMNHPWTELGRKYLYGVLPRPLHYAQCYRVLKIASERSEPKSLEYMAALIDRVCEMAKKDALRNEIASFLLESAQDGSAVAALALGHHYKHKNLYTESLHWFTVAAQKDSILSGQTRKEMDDVFGLLSDFLKSSRNESYLGILEMYSKQHLTASLMLSSLHGNEAVGVAGVDETKAFQMYLKAAEEGDNDSQWQLYLFYHDGRGGVEKNEALAMEWFDKAAKNGHRMAKEMTDSYPCTIL